MNEAEPNTRAVLFNELTTTTARMGDLSDTISELEKILQKLRRDAEILENQKREIIGRLKQKIKWKTQ